MKIVAPQTILTAAITINLFFSCTKAAVIFEAWNFKWNPDLSSANSQGWKIQLPSPLMSSGDLVFRDVAFYTDSECDSTSRVDLTDAKFNSSNGEAKYAFDNNNDTAWNASGVMDISDERPFIEYEDGPDVHVKCITIDVNIPSRRNSIFDIWMKPAGNSSISWEQMYRVIGLQSGRNVFDLENMVCKAYTSSIYTWGNRICDPGMNNTGCQYDGGDCDDNTVGDNNDTIDEDCDYCDTRKRNDPPTLVIVGVVIIIVLIGSACQCYVRRMRRDNGPHPSQNNNVGNLDMNGGGPPANTLEYHVNGGDRLNNPIGPTAPPAEDDPKEIRRELILTAVIHKKAESKKKKDGYYGGEDDASVVVQPPAFGGGEDSETPRKIRKGDIFVDSERSWSKGGSFRKSSMEKNTSDSTLFSPKSCTICYERYKVGDDIAWSKNQNCLHAFHLECISDWLMEHEDCPICREKFLVSADA